MEAGDYTVSATCYERRRIARAAYDRRRKLRAGPRTPPPDPVRRVLVQRRPPTIMTFD